MSYADKIGVPYAVLLGDDEIAAGKCSVKDMRSGTQHLLTAEEAAQLIRENLEGNGPIILEK
jgi:histidyl-tRNA synthetase